MLVQIQPTQLIHYIQQESFLWLQQADYQAKVKEKGEMITNFLEFIQFRAALI